MDRFEYFEIDSQNGYTISCKRIIPEECRRIVIICHGYGGSMEGRTVASLSPLLADKGIGVISFDWCGHGMSMMSGEYFTVKNCLRDLDSVYCYAEDKYPSCDICLCGTSFGAYSVLLYNSIYARSVPRLVARCCALDMLDIFEKKLMGSELRHLTDYGSIVVEGERPITITEEFHTQLKKYDIHNEFKPMRTSYLFVHGTNDEIAPYYAVKEFCAEHDLTCETIDDADHFMSDDTKLAICNNAILRFFMS